MRQNIIQLRLGVAVGVFVLVLAAALVWLRDNDTDAVTVFAASSLTDAFEEIAEAYETANPGIDIVLNFGGSSSLAVQIVEGAPFDVFASANPVQMDVVAQAGLLAGPPVIFAQNRLVLIVPIDNPAGIESLRDLATPGVDLVLAAPGVPVREYTNTMLAGLSAEFGADYVAAVLDNLASEEENVRRVSLRIALGEADAGIVYTSDVTPELAERVRVFPIPDAVNTLAEYPIAVGDEASSEARSFVDFVLADEAQAILARWGLIPLN